MGTETDRRDLEKALEACLQSADRLGLTLVGVYLSHAIDIMRADAVQHKDPETNAR